MLDSSRSMSVCASLQEHLDQLLEVDRVVLDTVGVRETVVVDPFHHSERRENLAVVESGSSTDKIVGRSAHHG